CIRSTHRHIWSEVGSTTNLEARLQALTRELDAGIALDAPGRRPPPVRAPGLTRGRLAGAPGRARPVGFEPGRMCGARRAATGRGTAPHARLLLRPTKELRPAQRSGSCR